ncbi:MAG: lectin like domain-containing protein, partial [Elusimicrobia bacterium]|nr:lectin like domain-containing protein [Elusimicrobiota bacterium]
SYQYDPLGWVTDYTAGGTTGWLAGVFTGTGYSETIRQAGFYTTDVNASYEVRLYTDVASGPTSGTLADTKTGSFPQAGFHTVDLNPTQIARNQRFSVVVKLVNPTYAYPIAVEEPVAGYSSAATASDGQTYASADGAAWTDLNQAAANTSACVKAYTSDRVEVPGHTGELKGVRAYPNPARLSEGGQVRFADIPYDSQNVKIEIYTLSGQLVRTLTEGRGVGSDPGRAYQVGLWDGRDENGVKLASGVYLYVVTASNKAKKTARIGLIW